MTFVDLERWYCHQGGRYYDSLFAATLAVFVDINFIQILVIWFNIISHMRFISYVIGLLSLSQQCQINGIYAKLAIAML